jgi:exonuclease I
VYLVLGHETGPAGQWWLLNLDRDPSTLLTQDPEQVSREWFTRDRPEEWRALQRINPRRFPFVIPAGPRQYDLLDGYGLTRDAIETNRTVALRAGVSAWAERFLRARDAELAETAGADSSRPRDVDAQLYDNLPSDEDRRVLHALESSSTREIATLLAQVELADGRNRELARRFVGRYLPERLSSDARQAFRAEAAQRLDIEGFDEVWRSASNAVRDGTARSGLPVNRQVNVLRQLREHRNSLVRRMGLESRYGELSDEPGR